MGDFRFALSADNPGTGSETFSVAAGYTMAGFGIGFGYEDTGVVDHWIIGVNGSFGDVSMRAIYGEAGVSDQYGVSASADFSGVGVTAFYREDFASVEHYGLGMSYGLGGGATLAGGIVSTGGQTRADFGVRFSF
jgi:outer membrane protein OmpU